MGDKANYAGAISAIKPIFEVWCLLGRILKLTEIEQSQIPSVMVGKEPLEESCR